MDPLTTSIDLAVEIRQKVEQVGIITIDCTSITTDIVEPLSRIQKWLDHRLMCPAGGLHNTLLAIENELRGISVSLQNLIQHHADEVSGSLATNAAEFDN
ncbi:hypothetical protein FRC02_007227, partial [Tulasnella sp. 418]